MAVPAWIIIAAALVMALPFGWGLGLAAAYLIAGREFGQLPAGTVPLGIVAAVAFALSPIALPATRLAVMVIGTGVLLVLGYALT